ncbi:MAG: metallophosphoesterase [Cytophagales bacterium]|nr:metallophosphoesterase [Cytophagales bacterium]
MKAPISPPAEDAEKLGFTRQPMTGWFSPAQLARTGLQSVVSGLFGTYADRREVQACLSDFKIYDYSRSLEEGGTPSSVPDRWIDFVSDLGDGFNPTYAVAYLMGQPELTLDHPGPTPEGPDAPAPLQYETKRGNILVMGGDQVYPTPGADGYAQRLVGPFRAARSYVEQNPPSVFAIPGNHDWYDGLSAFLKLFCQPDRWIGAWKTQQQRSYFAIKLPYNWWLWGIDIQLCGRAKAK